MKLIQTEPQNEVRWVAALKSRHRFQLITAERKEEEKWRPQNKNKSNIIKRNKSS